MALQQEITKARKARRIAYIKHRIEVDRATMEEVGNELNITRERVRQLIVKAGINAPRSHKNVAERSKIRRATLQTERVRKRLKKAQRFKELLNLIKSGHSIPTAAYLLGMKYEAVRVSMRRAGVVVGAIRGHKLNRYNFKAVEAFSKEGKTVKEVTVQFGFPNENAARMYLYMHKLPYVKIRERKNVNLSQSQNKHSLGGSAHNPQAGTAQASASK